MERFTGLLQNRIAGSLSNAATVSFSILLGMENISFKFKEH
jgi:hypothetical protein